MLATPGCCAREMGALLLAGVFWGVLLGRVPLALAVLARMAMIRFGVFGDGESTYGATFWSALLLRMGSDMVRYAGARWMGRVEMCWQREVERLGATVLLLHDAPRRKVTANTKHVQGGASKKTSSYSLRNHDRLSYIQYIDNDSTGKARSNFHYYSLRVGDHYPVVPRPARLAAKAVLSPI